MPDKPRVPARSVPISLEPAAMARLEAGEVSAGVARDLGVSRKAPCGSRAPWEAERSAAVAPGPGQERSGPASGVCRPRRITHAAAILGVSSTSQGYWPRLWAARAGSSVKLSTGSAAEVSPIGSPPGAKARLAPPKTWSPPSTRPARFELTT